MAVVPKSSGTLPRTGPESVLRLPGDHCALIKVQEENGRQRAAVGSGCLPAHPGMSHLAKVRCPPPFCRWGLDSDRVVTRMDYPNVGASRLLTPRRRFPIGLCLGGGPVRLRQGPANSGFGDVRAG
jgi:hypothetical protein